LVVDVDERTRTIRLKPSRGGKVPLFGVVERGFTTRSVARCAISTPAGRHHHFWTRLRASFGGSSRSLQGSATTRNERYPACPNHVPRVLGRRPDSEYHPTVTRFSRHPRGTIGPIISTEKASPAAVQQILAEATTDLVDLVHLASHAKNKIENKYDAFLGAHLLCREYASRQLAPIRLGHSSPAKG